MGVEVVFHEHDLRGSGKMCIGQVPEHVGEIHGGVVVGYLNMAPTLQRREHHEQIARAIPFILIEVDPENWTGC